MTILRMCAAAALVALAVAASAAAHPNEFELRNRLNVALQPGVPGPAPPQSPRASSWNVEVIGHADPGGFNGDVVANKGYAYLGSWGTAFDEETYEQGTFCPSQSLRVYSLFNLANPTHVATFASAADDPAVAGSWTEKVIVRHVSTQWFNGDLAAVSFQDCQVGASGGSGSTTSPTLRTPSSSRSTRTGSSAFTSSGSSRAGTGPTSTRPRSSKR